MRSNQNPSSTVTRNVDDRRAGDRSLVAKLNMSQMPMEWLDSGSWRLPSGKALAEFALQAGFLAPLMFRANGAGVFNRTTANGLGSITARGKGLGKGDGR